MSKTYFNISEQKTNVISFIKKHKDILCVDDDCKAITAKFIGELVKTNNKEFFRLVHKVRLNFGQNFYIFSDNCDENRLSIEIWLPIDLSKIASDKAIKELCGSYSFEDVIEDSSYWYKMTPKRWETFEAVFDFYDKQKTPAKKTAKKAKKTAKKTVKKTVKKTAKTYFTFSEQKQNVISFIKKHKDILGVSESYMHICAGHPNQLKDITDEYLDELKNANNEEFLRLANYVKLKLGQNFFIFSDNWDKKHPMITIWLPTVLSESSSDKAIKEFCSINSFNAVIEKGYCSWYKMTPKRWEAFEAVFDFYDKQNSKLAKQLFDLYDKKKKTAKKAKKIVKPEEVKLNDYALLKDDIAFIDFETKEFDHLMMQCNSNINVFIDSKSECNANNQIDHLINAAKLAKKEADTLIELLENAKKLGAKHVVDSNYAKPTEFDFTK